MTKKNRDVIKITTFKNNEYLGKITGVRKIKDKFHKLPVIIVDISIFANNKIFNFTQSTSWHVAENGNNLVKVRLRNDHVEILEDLKPEEVDEETMANFLIALDIDKNL